MNIGIFDPPGLPESFRVCAENIAAGLEAAGARITRFATAEAMPRDVDAYWDPRSGGGNPPAEFVRTARRPCVVTAHGAGPLELPSAYQEGRFGWLRVRADNWAKRRAWARLAPHCAAIVAVSHFGKANIVRHLGLDPAQVFVCPNAVNHALFLPPAEKPAGPRYLLHISNDEPRKNVDRIVAAYRLLDIPDRPELWLKLPPGTPRVAGDGVRVISHRADDAEIAALYAGAWAFVFPSLYEGFGLPILEAMASLCPVITANGNACAEVAADAALTVDPRSVEAIAAAMREISTSPARRDELMRGGLARAAMFTWERTGREYLAVFEHAIARKQAA